jgi:predicted nucleic acid-binding protein
MKYLLDTNVVSEIRKPTLDLQVKKWFDTMSPSSLCISVLTLGEIRKGIEKLPESHKKQELMFFLENDIPRWFGANILPITLEVADKWGYLTSSYKVANDHAIDSLLAATALTHNLKMVTRNVQDFNVPGLEIINPWC